ncbi:hypothetical protein B0T11DRAFT_294929 [Plectosphaerella cucumerina]|uniref:Uncharacterized protein n=1 Tax=Plectosphaerella cucumerina TaxID=40658 RepID=A0A8K0TK58_9PEZI|nr:hypothetical protein B0T11DRAFT_294929 [Plectosphaerella cucumerina]
MPEGLRVCYPMRSAARWNVGENGRGWSGGGRSEKGQLLAANVLARGQVGAREHEVRACEMNSSASLRSNLASCRKQASKQASKQTPGGGQNQPPPRLQQDGAPTSTSAWAGHANRHDGRLWLHWFVPGSTAIAPGRAPRDGADPTVGGRKKFEKKGWWDPKDGWPTETRVRIFVGVLRDAPRCGGMTSTALNSEGTPRVGVYRGRIGLEHRSAPLVREACQMRSLVRAVEGSQPRRPGFTLLGGMPRVAHAHAHAADAAQTAHGPMRAAQNGF